MFKSARQKIAKDEESEDDSEEDDEDEEDSEAEGNPLLRILLQIKSCSSEKKEQNMPPLTRRMF